MLLATYVFAKTVNFSFSINKIPQACPTNMLKLLENSAESEEHSRYLQSILEVHRKLFLRDFQKTFFFKNPPFCMCLGYFSLEKKGFSKKKFFENVPEKVFCALLGCFVCIWRYLKGCPRSGLCSAHRIMVVARAGQFLFKKSLTPP